MSHHRAVMEDFMNGKHKLKVVGMRNFWTTDVVSCNNGSQKGDKDQESIKLSTTPDPRYHMGN